MSMENVRYQSQPYRGFVEGDEVDALQYFMKSAIVPFIGAGLDCATLSFASFFFYREKN